jgi:tungstate transport system substrate-binding protein
MSKGKRVSKLYVISHKEESMKTGVRMGTIVLVLLTFVIMALTAQASPTTRNMILATTTSTQDSGLLDVLIPLFEKKSGYFVKTISVGSGQAMAMGRRGEADVLLVHSPAAEKQFMAEGFGTERVIVMFNDFVIIGPADDPAKIRGMRSTVEAMRRIAGAGALFLSRGDNSGTHAKERSIWSAAGINPVGLRWYQETGQGMGHTLNVAAEKRGYTLTDRGTYLSLRRHLAGFPILVEGDGILLNVYHVIGVNHIRYPKVNAAAARAFTEFLVAPETQETIKGFGVDRFGSALFFPAAGRKEDDLGK